MFNIDFNFNFNLAIPVFVIIGMASGGGLVLYFVKHPDKLETLLALINKICKSIIKKAEYNFVKYDVQSTVNKYISTFSKKIPNLSVTHVKLEWIDENITPEQFIKSDQLVMRMHKSINQNRNIVNATFTFVSYSLLRKAKSYIAQYQKDAIDLFVSFKIIENTKYELLDEFVQQYLNEGLEHDKVADFYDKFFDIDKAGLYFPVFMTEMTFLGEKVFAKRKDKNIIYEEVKGLVNFLNIYANRKINDTTTTEHNGNYCRFAIRIIGKKSKIDREGEQVYINNLKRIDPKTETIYLICDELNIKFMHNVLDKCLNHIDFNIYNKYKYHAVIKDHEGNDMQTNSYLVILRNKKIAVYHKD
ncbi:hypothetical protein [Odoribacter laneus]|uniref:hypothetical protein n=1 Tax=Odoribacter laneus TaxID=626933 RepID=UPI00033B9873|nr:hypothetical protein [Odoribacter laneus]CCZ82243.1 uncharacterized protein BN709_01515 [Odoribacter laneus CAG:561]